jgi:16S rRNA (adenine1518-N6/adenine1519-N6)-dimethyltransferase
LANFRPRKRFGQNFLVNPGIIQKIIEVVNPQTGDTILEIGPGKGALTQLLLNSSAETYAVEIDRDLCAELEKKLGSLENFHLINGDFLEIDLDAFIATIDSEKLKIVGNIPYNITTPIITSLLENYQMIDFGVLMVQWEVAKRLTASESDGKDYGSISLAVEYCAEAEICFKVSKGSFYPIPKVDSAVIKLEMRQTPAVDVSDEALLFQVIHTAFNYRRKMLRSCLRNPPLNLTKSQIQKISESTTIDMKRRGETLSLEEFSELTDIIYGTFPEKSVRNL